MPDSKVNNTTSTEKKRFMLAKASNRFFARVIDIIIVGAFCVGLSILIIFGDRVGLKNANKLHDQWRYLIISLISFITFFLYFIVLPSCSKWNTIGFLILRLKTINLIPTKNFFLNLFKKEIFLWMVISLSEIIFGFVLTFSKNTEELLNDYFTFKKNTNIVITIIETIQMIGIVIIIFVIINMFLNNKKRCLIDKISDTCVIKHIDVNKQDKNKSLNKKNKLSRNVYSLPGEITPEANDEINSL